MKLFGEDIGQNSWLTSDEQDRFLEWLDLSPGKTQLDVACVRGALGRDPARSNQEGIQEQASHVWGQLPAAGMFKFVEACHWIP